MKKIFSFFAAMLVAVAVSAQTDFAVPGYSCAADDAILTGSSSSSNFWLDQTTDSHYVAWQDVSLSSNSVATWTITASRGCYVAVALDLGPMVANNKHVFEVKILDAQGNLKGTVAEGLATDNGGDGYKDDYNMIKTLSGTILIPAAGTYTVELRNIRDWGKGSVKNVILTYDSDAPTEMIAVSSIELNKEVLSLEMNEVEQLIATVLPEDAFDPSVTWQSYDESVVSVIDGFVTAVGIGTTTIAASAGDLASSCSVTVSATTNPDVDFAEPYVLSAKKAQLDGAVWKMYKDETYKLYGDGGHNKNYGNAIWVINVTRPCIVSGVLNGVEGGHLFALDAYRGEELKGTIDHPEAKKWDGGEIALDGTLTFAEAGEYILKLRNTQEWSSGKVASVTLTLVEDLTPAAGPEYFLTGTFNEWATNDAAYKFVVNPKAQTEGEYMLLGVELEANAGIKVVGNGSFYPEGYETEKVIAEAGTYDIYFRPDGQGGEGWHYGVFYVTPSVVEPVAVAKDFEIDMQTAVFGEGLDKYLYIDGEGQYNYSDAMPAEYNAHFVAQGFTDGHGYHQLAATVPVEAGEYKVTLGNCMYAYSADYTMAYVKNADESQTLTSVKQNYTQNEEGAVCYHQDPANNVATMTFTVEEAQMVVIKCAHYTPYIKFEKINGATGMENVNAVKVVKMIENGQVVIIKNGVKYNVMGAELR